MTYVTASENELPPSMRTLLADLWNDFKLLEIRIEELSKQIQRSVQYSDTARRLMTVPGIGPLAASALEASAGNGHQFANGRFCSRTVSDSCPQAERILIVVARARLRCEQGDILNRKPQPGERTKLKRNCGGACLTPFRGPLAPLSG